MKILIVEDEEVLIKVLKEKLEKEKFTVELAIDGETVLPIAKKTKPNLILLDIILPNKDGLSVLEELKASPETKHIPVIMISNLGEDENIKKALELGAVDYLVKTQHPINEVIEKVKNHLIK